MRKKMVVVMVVVATNFCVRCLLIESAANFRVKSTPSYLGAL